VSAVAATARHGPSRRSRRRGVGTALVSLVGELLITAGVLLGLFVVWQLWWTDVQAEREHAQILAGLDWPEPGSAAPADGGEGEGPAGDDGAGEGAAGEGTASDDGAPPAIAPPQRGEPPVAAEPAVGTVFAQLYVPRFGAGYVEPIAQGIDKQRILDRMGIGHYPGTAMPGDLGNFATAGHRTTYGRPFHQVAELEPGDPIVVRTVDTWYVYRVSDQRIVWPWQVEVISAVPGVKPGEPLPELTERYLTMTACHPLYSAAQRYVVHAILDYWAPVSAGVPAELVEAGVDVGGS
jgi:sortase A